MRDPGSTTYAASFESAEVFAHSLLQEARLRGLGKAGRSVVIGDGAHRIWNQAAINFPQAIQVLDYCHAREHLTALCEAVYPEQKQCDEQIKKRVKRIDEGKAELIAEKADRKKARNGKRRETANREIEYFRTNAGRMRYASFKERGLFIGSGVIEAGCKTVVGKRTKQSGMFWKVSGAQNIPDIRSSVLSDTCDHYRNCGKTSQLQQFKAAA